MENFILLRAGIKRHLGGLTGIVLLMFIVSLTLSTLLSVWMNGSRYLQEELVRMGYGDLTAWVSDVPDTANLAGELSALPQIEQVGIQPLLFASYRIGEQESDSEGQLIGYDPSQYPYRIFADDLTGYREEPLEISPNEIYLSPSLASVFGAELGEQVTIPIARGNETRVFTVAGWFEDPFMGSSMIGMKSFLINPEDFASLNAAANAAGIDALARSGAMLHIVGKDNSAAGLSKILNSSTSLPQFLEFSHSNASISSFMLVLQNAFTGFLLAFAAVLLSVTAAVLGHSIASAIEQDYSNIGILKSMGFTAAKLKQVQLLQYLLPILCGILLGLAASFPLAHISVRIMVTTTGLLLPNKMPLGLFTLSYTGILFLFSFFIFLKTAKINRVSPLQAIHGTDSAAEIRRTTPIYSRGLSFWMTLRQLAAGKKQYISACIVAALLVFFASLIGRMNVWLGPNGEGMMDAFNPADLDIAVQPLGEVELADVETTISGISQIVEQYELAMPSVAANGVQLTANVITQPERFHLLAGRTSSADDEVVLTQTAAADLDVTIGSAITLSAGAGSGQFTVTGIYQCANDMGANLGMTREGYARIGEDNSKMWCRHYFLENPERQPDVVLALQSAYGNDLHVHENTWPGLEGILSAMRALLTLMYAAVTVFIFVVTALASSKLLIKERRDLSICKALGFSSAQLRLAFSLRFGVVSLFGASLGVLFSALFTDPLVATVMRLLGISNFSSQLGFTSVFLPAATVVCLFTALSYLAAANIRRVSTTALIAEQ